LFLPIFLEIPDTRCRVFKKGFNFAYNLLFINFKGFNFLVFLRVNKTKGGLLRMPKVLVCGRGGSGKSTLVTMLARILGERSKVLVVDTDESNLGLGKMLGLQVPAETLMDTLGGKKAVMGELMAMLKGEGKEEVKMFSGDFGFKEEEAQHED
jgi:ATPase subunit of ABC transporter with duplicated ATPase domains